MRLMQAHLAFGLLALSPLLLACMDNRVVIGLCVCTSYPECVAIAIHPTAILYYRRNFCFCFDIVLTLTLYAAYFCALFSLCAPHLGAAALAGEHGQ